MPVAQTMPVMITQVVAMFLMMVIGAVLYRGQLVDNAGSKQLSNVALYVATPAVILQSLATTFDAAKMVAGAACMALSFIFTLVSAGVARLLARGFNSFSRTTGNPSMDSLAYPLGTNHNMPKQLSCIGIIICRKRRQLF